MQLSLELNGLTAAFVAAIPGGWFGCHQLSFVHGNNSAVFANNGAGKWIVENSGNFHRAKDPPWSGKIFRGQTSVLLRYKNGKDGLITGEGGRFAGSLTLFFTSEDTGMITIKDMLARVSKYLMRGRAYKIAPLVPVSVCNESIHQAAHEVFYQCEVDEGPPTVHFFRTRGTGSRRLDGTKGMGEARRDRVEYGEERTWVQVGRKSHSKMSYASAHAPYLFFSLVGSVS
jgi:hypothetical protein